MSECSNNKTETNSKIDPILLLAELAVTVSKQIQNYQIFKDETIRQIEFLKEQICRLDQALFDGFRKIEDFTNQPNNCGSSTSANNEVST